MPNHDSDSIGKSLRYDATNSWSGYNYQGKTAIYIALKKINALHGSSDDAVIPSYFLELEWLEDFSIIHQADRKKNYESIHQVKAREDTQISAYAQALTLLIQEIEKYSTIGNAYLHTINPIDYPSGQWNKAVSDVITTEAVLQSLINQVDDYMGDPNKMKELAEKISQSGRPTNFISSLKNEYKKKHPGKKITKDTISESLVLYKESLQKDLDYCKKAFHKVIYKKLSFTLMTIKQRLKSIVHWIKLMN